MTCPQRCPNRITGNCPDCPRINGAPSMEDPTPAIDPESVPETLPAEWTADWIAKVKDLHQTALDHGVRVTIHVGSGSASLGFVTSDALPGILPDLADATPWHAFASDSGAPVRNYRIDGCDVSTHDMRVASRVCSVTDQRS